MRTRRGQWWPGAGLTLVLIAMIGLRGGPAVKAGPLGTHGQVAFAAQGQIYLYDLDTNAMTALTDSGTNASPAWAPGGDWLAYTHRASADGPGRIYRMHADGTGQAPATAGSGEEDFPAYGPDGML